jgi:serine/threonine protein kinase
MTYSAEEALPLGAEVRGRYRTLAIVGRGGVGTVYKVADVLYGNTYALKELANPSPSARKQFENEAQWLEALNHPNIPRVREFFEWEGRVYLVMDFVDGENLEQMLARTGGRPLPEPRVIAWTLPICAALHYLHAQQPPILHRDVKPANIIVTPAGHPVLVDLGIAKEHLPGAGMTATFVKKAGTEGYAPPEQYTTSGKTGPWSDVYGMGATLYELLTGTVPPTAVERVALDSPMLRPRTINAAISPHIDDAVTRALALRPADRFQSMAELARALRGESRSSAPSLSAGGSGAGVFPFAPPSPPRTPPSAPSGFSGVSGPSGGLSALPSLDPPLPNPAASQGASLYGSMPANPGSSAGPYARTRRGAVLPPAGRPSGPRNTKPAVSVVVKEQARPQERTTERTTERASRRGVSRGVAWLLGLVAALVALGVVAGVIAVFVLGMFAPPDRSTPHATVTGYFAALSAQDYARAWQYSSTSHSDPSSQANFVGNLKTDDDRFGRVISVGTVAITQDSPGSAHATVTAQRAGGSGSSGTQTTYTLVLTLYDGSTWLIDSISGS